VPLTTNDLNGMLLTTYYLNGVLLTTEHLSGWFSLLNTYTGATRRSLPERGAPHC